MMKGRFFYELPWPKRDLGQSAKLLQQAIDKCPMALRAYLYLAETQVKDGDAKLAQQTIAKALARNLDEDPPEGRRMHERLRKLQAEIARK